jgi:hypothetical protein
VLASSLQPLASSLQSLNGVKVEEK